MNDADYAKHDEDSNAAMAGWVTQQEAEYEAYMEAYDGEPCPACGAAPQYCSGHGEIGDPEGYAVLTQHDNENHEDCHYRAECRIDEMDVDPW